MRAGIFLHRLYPGGQRVLVQDVQHHQGPGRGKIRQGGNCWTKSAAASSEARANRALVKQVPVAAVPATDAGLNPCTVMSLMNGTTWFACPGCRGREPPSQQRPQRQQSEAARKQREEPDAALREEEAGGRSLGGRVPNWPAVGERRQFVIRARVSIHYVRAGSMWRDRETNGALCQGSDRLAGYVPYSSEIKPIYRRFDTEYNTLMVECVSGKH
ncbi:hypothetical protein DL771_006371 [Monosporascus sp. 5C6A]|nr:hypothetical protein DL771_006371 [Monosporascus sp. 5C6A]